MSGRNDSARARLIKTRRGPWIDESLLPAVRQECLETLRAAAGAMRARGESPVYGDFAWSELNTLSKELLRNEIPEEVAARNLAYEANEAGGMCGCCGRELAGREPAYFGAEIYVGMWPLRRNRDSPRICEPRYIRTVLCGSCAPEWLSPERDDIVTQLCANCDRPMISRLRLSELQSTFCCESCERSYRNQLRREKRAQRRKRVCPNCKEEFTPTRKDHEFCTQKCKQKAYRERKEAREKQQ